MSETLNVNVLVAAKEEYTRQLVSTIQQDVYDILKSIFNDSQEKNVRRKISYSNYQLELKQYKVSRLIDKQKESNKLLS